MEGEIMIYLYTEMEDDSGWILKNDLFFNLYTANMPFTQDDKDIIKTIDNANVTADNHIETKYGIGTIRNLSSGCKTYLNVIKNPDKIISAEECGGNVLSLLFRLDGVHLYMNHPERFEIEDTVEINFNNRETMTGKKGYEQWWSREYERREQDDL